MTWARVPGGTYRAEACFAALSTGNLPDAWERIVEGLQVPVFVPDAALIVAGCACLVRYLVRGSSPALLGAGLALGAGALVRPVGLVLLPAWVLLVFLRRKSGGSRRAIAGSVTLLVLAFLLTTLPWMVRNQRIWGVLTLSSIGNWDLGYYIASATLAGADHIPLEEARERIPISSVPQPGDSAEYLESCSRTPSRS